MSGDALIDPAAERLARHLGMTDGSLREMSTEELRQTAAALREVQVALDRAVREHER